MVEEISFIYITMVHFVEASTEPLMLDVEDPGRGMRATSRDEVDITKGRVVVFHRDFKGETITGFYKQAVLPRKQATRMPDG